MSNRTLPCNRCGKMLYRSSTSLPEGEARCRACRNVEPQPSGPRPGSVGRRALMRLTICPWCSTEFVGHTKFCTRAHAWASVGERQRVRTLDDPHQERKAREKHAPGLSGKQRSDLLKRWMRQGKACAYCEALATTVDHVVPLVRGGTNYEGNLAPCCRPCNGRKGYCTVIEWRTGRRLPRMTHALKVRPPRPVKVKPPKPTHPCPVCRAETTMRASCSPECSRESNDRKTRDKYRASHGLLVDLDEPTKRWRSSDATQLRILRRALRGEAA